MTDSTPALSSGDSLLYQEMNLSSLSVSAEKKCSVFTSVTTIVLLIAIAAVVLLTPVRVIVSPVATLMWVHTPLKRQTNSAPSETQRKLVAPTSFSGMTFLMARS